MTESPRLPNHLERYLLRLRSALRWVSEDERNGIVAEVRSHLVDRLQDSPAAAERALAAFGDPEAYARSFVQGSDLRAALARDSQSDLFLHLLRAAGGGIWWFGATLVVLLLGLSAMTFGVMAFLKPFVPDLMGLWIRGEGDFVFGIASQSSRAGAREVLGYWLIPIALGVSILSTVTAKRLTRRVLTMHLRSLEGPAKGA